MQNSSSFLPPPKAIPTSVPDLERWTAVALTIHQLFDEALVPSASCTLFVQSHNAPPSICPSFVRRQLPPPVQRLVPQSASLKCHTFRRCGAVSGILKLTCVKTRLSSDTAAPGCAVQSITSVNTKMKNVCSANGSLTICQSLDIPKCRTARLPFELG